MIERIDRNLLNSFILALFGHLLIFTLLPQFSIKKQVTTPSSPILNIKTYDQESLNKLRTVGVKNGAKKFSAPLKPVVQKSMNELRPQKIIPIKKVKPVEKPIAGALFDGKKLKMGAEEKLTQGLEKSRILKSMPLPSAVAQSLGRSNLNIKFEPPEGVDENELNSSEKKFYSFTKRSYETYVVAVIRSLNDLLRDKPHLKNLRNIGEHHLTGRIIFDKNGYPISLRFIQPSKDDNIQLLFENSLKGIQILHNPPRELLDSKTSLLFTTN